MLNCKCFTCTCIQSCDFDYVLDLIYDSNGMGKYDRHVHVVCIFTSADVSLLKRYMYTCKFYAFSYITIV